MWCGHPSTADALVQSRMQQFNYKKIDIKVKDNAAKCRGGSNTKRQNDLLESLNNLFKILALSSPIYGRDVADAIMHHPLRQVKGEIKCNIMTFTAILFLNNYKFHLSMC